MTKDIPIVVCCDSHVGEGAIALGRRLHEQIEFYAAAAGLSGSDVVVLHGGDLIHDMGKHDFFDTDHDETRIARVSQLLNAMVDRAMQCKLPDPPAVMARLPKRTKDWEQRDRKRRRK